MVEQKEINNEVIKAWRKATVDLGLKIQSPFNLKVNSGKIIEYGLLLEDFGSKLGTIIYTTFEKDDDEDEPWKYGLFSSALNPESYSKYDRQHFIDTLNDWGFYGDKIKTPDWYTGQPWTE